jgi:hypothetical protein
MRLEITHPGTRLDGTARLLVRVGLALDEAEDGLLIEHCGGAGFRWGSDSRLLPDTSSAIAELVDVLVDARWVLPDGTEVQR